MTLEAWFRAPEQAEVFDPIVLADFPRIYLEFFPDREQLKVVLPIKGKSTAFLPMAHPHDWHHFAVTSDGLRGAVFLDGEPILEEVLDASGNAPMPQPTLRLGGSGKFPLLVDEVRVWSYGRSKEQLQAAMKRSLSGEEPGLLAYFSFEGDASGSITNKVVHPKWIPSAVPTPAKVAFVMDSPLAEPRVLDAGSSTPSTMPAGSSQSAH